MFRLTYQSRTWRSGFRKLGIWALLPEGQDDAVSMSKAAGRLCSPAQLTTADQLSAGPDSCSEGCLLGGRARAQEWNKVKQPGGLEERCCCNCWCNFCDSGPNLLLIPLLVPVESILFFKPPLWSSSYKKKTSCHFARADYKVMWELPTVAALITKQHCSKSCAQKAAIATSLLET